jgi:hypothetical protein
VAPSLDKFRGINPREIVAGALAGLVFYKLPDAVREDYLSGYEGDRMVESMRFVRAGRRATSVPSGDKGGLCDACTDQASGPAGHRDRWRRRWGGHTGHALARVISPVTAAPRCAFWPACRLARRIAHTRECAAPMTSVCPAYITALP